MSSSDSNTDLLGTVNAAFARGDIPTVLAALASD